MRTDTEAGTMEEAKGARNRVEVLSLIFASNAALRIVSCTMTMPAKICRRRTCAFAGGQQLTTETLCGSLVTVGPRPKSGAETLGRCLNASSPSPPPPPATTTTIFPPPHNTCSHAQCTWIVMELTMPIRRRDRRSSFSLDVRRDRSSSRSVSWMRANRVWPLASCDRMCQCHGDRVNQGAVPPANRAGDDTGIESCPGRYQGQHAMVP